MESGKYRNLLVQERWVQQSYNCCTHLLFLSKNLYPSDLVQKKSHI